MLIRAKLFGRYSAILTGFFAHENGQAGFNGGQFDRKSTLLFIGQRA
jgi:hypothetical protein